MSSKQARNFLWLIVLLVFVGARPARAQAPLEPSQLPPRTMFYLIWRGAPAPNARAANSLFALWDDPDFASVRSALADGVLSSSTKESSRPKLTAQEFGEFASLLENSFTLGYISEPAAHRRANLTASAEAKPAAWNGLFLVYNRAGKEELLTKAVLRLRAAAKDPPRISQVSLGGMQVLKVERATGSSYWAEQGKYAISASESSIMEDLLGRLGNPSPQAASLAQSAAYQEAQRTVGGGVLEFFLRVPDLKDLAEDSKAGQFQVRPLLDAARLDAVHSLGGHVSFEGSRTHLQAAILGDPAPGTPFDIWSSGQATPASLGFAPAETISYTFAQINFLGIYDTVKRIARAIFPAGPQANADLLDTMAEKRLGMPLTEALGLFTGEFASLQTNPSLDTTGQVFFGAIRNKAQALKLLRSLFGERLASERNEGDVTFLKISLGGNHSSAGMAQWNFFDLAVTPDMIIGASRVNMLREVLAHRSTDPAAPGLASVPQFQVNRTKAPVNLNGLSYFDFQKVDWQAARDRWIAEAKKTSVAKSAAGTSPSESLNTAGWLSQINPQVLSRHLHSSWSFSWKDSKGIHWDQWVE